MDAMALTVDGSVYRVRIEYPTLQRMAQLVEGINAGDMLSGRHERDLKGTKIPYTMTINPDPRYQADYDALFDLLATPVDSHSVSLPYGQTALSFDAMIEAVSDVYRGQLAGQRRWAGMAVTFRPIRPQKAVTA